MIADSSCMNSLAFRELRVACDVIEPILDVSHDVIEPILDERVTYIFHIAVE